MFRITPRPPSPWDHDEDSASSSSGEEVINVAVAPPMTATTPSTVAHTQPHPVGTVANHNAGRITASLSRSRLGVEPALLLTLRIPPGASREAWRKIVDSRGRSGPVPRATGFASPSMKVEQRGDDDALREGPNHRGTYSKEYTLKHPEITWIHRGQGRYLPSSEVKTEQRTASPQPIRYV